MNVALLFLALSAFVFNAVVGDDAVPEYKILAHQTDTFFKGLGICGHYGMRLAAPKTEVQVQALVQKFFAEGYSSADSFYIAGTNSADNYYYWMTDNTKVGGYTWWGPGQPNNTVPGDYCIAFSGTYTLWKWKNVSCLQNFQVVCEVLPVKANVVSARGIETELA